MAEEIRVNGLTAGDQTFSEIKKEEEEAKDTEPSSTTQEPTTRRKDMKPDADSSSSNTSIPDKSRTDMQALEEKVRSKDDYSWQTNKRWEAHAGIVMDLQRLWQGGLFDDYKTTHRVLPFGRNFHFK